MQAKNVLLAVNPLRPGNQPKLYGKDKVKLNEFLAITVVIHEKSKSYTLKQSGTGPLYHRLIVCHLEEFLKANKPHDLNSLASDQSLDAAYGMVKAIARPLGLYDNGPEGTKHENTRMVLFRFNQATYKRQEFKDLHQGNNDLRLQTDE